MLKRGKNERDVIEIVDTESLVPPGHLLRQVDVAVDCKKRYEIVEPLYREERRCNIDLVVLFKIVLFQHLDGNASLRGKMLYALLCYAIVDKGRSFSPWGYLRKIS